MTFVLHLQGNQLTMVEINYSRSHHRSLLQEFFWQELDLVPDLSCLKVFVFLGSRTLQQAVFRPGCKCGNLKAEGLPLDRRGAANAGSMFLGEKWCRHTESNCGPHPYQGCALPLSYGGSV